MGLSTWMNGSSARYTSGLIPIRNPSGTAMIAAIPKPSATRPSEWASWMPMPLSLGPLS